MPEKSTATLFQDPRPLAERALPDPQFDGSKSKRPRRTVTVNLAESPLAWLHTYGHLTDRQFLAGEKLRSDFENGGLAPRVTMSWEHMAMARGKRGLHFGKWSVWNDYAAIGSEMADMD